MSDEVSENITPAQETAFRRLSAFRYSDLRKDWEKAYDRLGGDPDGAVTAARTLMETTCKAVLDATSTEYDGNSDLPKLYFLASKQLGIAPSTQTDHLFRSMFGAANTIVNAIGELRNRVGDAHGKGFETVRASTDQAELAVNLAGSVAAFLISTLEHHLAATKRLDAEGRAVLRFDRTLVWRLRDHAANSKDWSKAYGERKAKPALWLVGDAGVYLMSNGKPPISHLGKTPKEGKKAEIPYLTAPALGCDPNQDEVEDWWPIHNAIAEGSDFTRPIPLGLIEAALADAKQEIVILADLDELGIFSDTQFDGER